MAEVTLDNLSDVVHATCLKAGFSKPLLMRVACSSDWALAQVLPCDGGFIHYVALDPERPKLAKRLLEPGAVPKNRMLSSYQRLVIKAWEAERRDLDWEEDAQAAVHLYRGWAQQAGHKYGPTLQESLLIAEYSAQVSLVYASDLSDAYPDCAHYQVTTYMGGWLQQNQAAVTHVKFRDHMVQYIEEWKQHG